MEKANLEIMMVDFIRVHLLMGNLMEMVNHVIFTLFMKDNGKMVKWMEQEKVNGMILTKNSKHNTLDNTN
jgi:hypothetical protein